MLRQEPLGTAQPSKNFLGDTRAGGQGFLNDILALFLDCRIQLGSRDLTARSWVYRSLDPHKGREPRNAYPFAGRGDAHSPRMSSTDSCEHTTNDGCNVVRRVGTTQARSGSPPPRSADGASAVTSCYDSQTAGSAQPENADSTSLPVTSASRAEASRLVSREARA